MSFGKTMNEKVLPVIMKFVNMKGIIAIKDGILFTLPLTLIGSIFLLIACFPFKPFTDFMASTFGANWTEPFFKVQGATMNIIALVSVMGIAYIYAKNEGHEPFSAAVISLVIFVLTTTNSVSVKVEGLADPVVAGSVLPIDWTGGKGMITAIIIGLLVGATYSWFIKKDIKIKMPAGVPAGVVNAFSAIIPAVSMITVAFVVYIIFKYALNTTVVEWIYKIIQTPLQGMTDSVGGVIVITFTIPFLWFFGVHGATVVGGIMQGILMSNTLANQAILDAGKQLTLENGAHIVTQQFLDNFINMTGTGETIGLVLLMAFVAKSAQFKQLGRLSLVPGCFNINEPILFGTPIVMNPIMAVPFILVPMVNGLLTYAAIATNLMHPFSGIMPGWTTPPIISGFLIGGWRAGLAQAILLCVATAIYFPFFKKVDNMNYANEMAAEAGNGVQA